MFGEGIWGIGNLFLVCDVMLWNRIGRKSGHAERLLYLKRIDTEIFNHGTVHELAEAIVVGFLKVTD